MKTFKDKKGQVWNLELTIGAVKRVRDLMGVNLCEPEQPIAESQETLMSKLGTDEVFLCDIIYCLVKPQADARQITDEQFGELLGGGAILEANTAFYEELADFFQSRGRTDRKAAIEKQAQILNLAIQRATMMVDGIDSEKRVETTFSKLSTELQVISESTPTD